MNMRPDASYLQFDDLMSSQIGDRDPQYAAPPPPQPAVPFYMAPMPFYMAPFGFPRQFGPRYDEDEDFIAPIVAPSQGTDSSPKNIPIYGASGSDEPVAVTAPAVKEVKAEEVKRVEVPKVTPVEGEDVARVSESTLYECGPRGFQNKWGENNCFLNVILQSLFFLAPFATEFAATEEHTHTKNCVFCALKDIFVDYQFSEPKKVIAPTVMRKTLSDLFAPESRFMMNDIEDANEALEEILKELHVELHKGDEAEGNEDICQPPCLVHRTFGMEMMVQKTCTKCKAVSEPYLFSEWVIYSTVQAIVEKYATCRSFEKSISGSFFGHNFSCPESNKQCKGLTAEPKQYLLRRPPIMSFGFTWPSTTPPKELRESFINALPLSMDIDVMFPGSGDEKDSSGNFVLRGIVCFYGRHYVLLFMSRSKEISRVEEKIWYYFDDSHIREIGPWDNVKPFLKKNGLHPTVVFYVKP